MVLATVSEPVQVAGCLLVGVATGVLSGMFGIGGAVVSTPGIRSLGATPLQSVGSTLPSIFPSSVTGTLRYHREGLVEWDIVRWTGSFGIASSVGGSLLAKVVPGGGHLLMIATAALVAFTAYRTAFPRVAPAPAPASVGAAAVPVGEAEVAQPRLDWWRFGLIGFAAGGLSGLLGVGGGILMVPAFSGWVRLPLKRAIATSLAVVGILAIPGTVTHAFLGDIAWRFAIPLSIGVIPGARLGAHLAITASERRLRIAVGIVLGVISIVYAISEILAL